jgi:hypothetical protein
MRFQRMSEGVLLLVGIATGDLIWVYAALVALVLQVISPWLVPVALLVAVVDRRLRPHALGDLYYDLAGSRGSCTISVMVFIISLGLIHGGAPVAGWILLALPAASLVLAPTVGFCAGCTFYVLFRDLLARVGLARRTVDGTRDFDIETLTPDRQ